jgi:dolichyl-phosphate-mannose--protein O-mannosyl transferase
VKINKWLFLILILGLVLRLWNVDWDSGYHFHPDERWIVMVTERIEWVNPVRDWETFNSVDSPMNPKFFAYGSFRGQYAEINLVGRVVSVVFDVGTVGLVYLIGRIIFNDLDSRLRGNDKRRDRRVKLALLAAGLYTLCVLPIQLSHFYAVDTVLTFFVILTLYLLIRFLEVDSGQARMTKAWWLVGIGMTVGMAMATKVSGVMLVVPVGTALVISNWQLAIRNKGNMVDRVNWGRIWKIIKYGLVMFFVAGMTFVVLEPYAVVDWETFWRNMQEQGRMTQDAWTFPYTLQYVGTKAYLYPLEQMVK